MSSYKHSTLSMMLVATTASIFILILLALVIAVCFPDAYNLISKKELLVVILVGAYILVWNNIWSAYLTQRGTKKDYDLNQVPDNKLNEPEKLNIDESKPFGGYDLHTKTINNESTGISEETDG